MWLSEQIAHANSKPPIWIRIAPYFCVWLAPHCCDYSFNFFSFVGGSYNKTLQRGSNDGVRTGGIPLSIGEKSLKSHIGKDTSLMPFHRQRRFPSFVSNSAFIRFIFMLPQKLQRCLPNRCIDCLKIKEKNDTVWKSKKKMTKFHIGMQSGSVVTAKMNRHWIANR